MQARAAKHLAVAMLVDTMLTKTGEALTNVLEQQIKFFRDKEHTIVLPDSLAHRITTAIAV